MIKFYEISQIEKTDAPVGTVKAGVNGTKNYFVGSIVSGAVSTVSSNGSGMKLFAGYGKGDDMYTEFVVPSGGLMAAHDIKAQVGKCLQVSPESITYASIANYASISEGTKMKAGTDGNLTITTSTTGDLYFEVVKKINFGGDGVLVKVIQG